MNKLAQQQQSNMVKPQKIGGKKLPMTSKKMKTNKMPSYSKVEKSIRKTMGY